MTTARSPVKWFQFRQRILNWQNRKRDDQLARFNRARERSISLLQKRYGYSREKAISDLNRYYPKAWLG